MTGTSPQPTAAYGLGTLVADGPVADTDAAPHQPKPQARDYAILLKPRVMSLVVFTGLVGLLLAPGQIAVWQAFAAVICMAVGAGAAGAINMWYDRDIDQHMKRTMRRPIPAGRMPAGAALRFGVVLSVASVLAMGLLVNWAAAGLLALTILYYVLVYTMWLKRRTPQNIVIGGAAGALPPMIGWAAVTGGISIESVTLFSIIFLWTPPHFWALSLFCREDYQRAGVPMLPVVAGEAVTRRHILAYSLTLVPVSLAPWGLGMAGPAFGLAASILGAIFLWHAVRVLRDRTGTAGRPMFFFSILYLFLIFLFLLLDRAMAALI